MNPLASAFIPSFDLSFVAPTPPPSPKPPAEARSIKTSRWAVYEAQAPTVETPRQASKEVKDCGLAASRWAVKEATVPAIESATATATIEKARNPGLALSPWTVKEAQPSTTASSKSKQEVAVKKPATPSTSSSRASTPSTMSSTTTSNPSTLLGRVAVAGPVLRDDTSKNQRYATWNAEVAAYERRHRISEACGDKCPEAVTDAEQFALRRILTTTGTALSRWAKK